MLHFYKCIKPKQPKRRQTLAGQIKALASADIHRAMALAEKGREMGEQERLLHIYLQTLDMKKPKEMEKGAAILPQKLFQDVMQSYDRCIERDRARFSKQLIEAVDKLDYETFFRFGIALKRLKDDKVIADRYRSSILLIKFVSERTSNALTLREIATMADWPQMQSADGFSQLRKMCKELGCPVAPSRQIRRRR